MPFNWKQYDQQCSKMCKSELRREVANQSETIATAGAGTGFALLAVPLTMGISAVAIGGTAPAIINARKKRNIARKYLALDPPENHPTVIQPVRRLQGRAVARRHSTGDDELPDYHAVPDEGETQLETYTAPEEDLPPTYDDATIRRLTMMGIPPTYDEATLRRMTMMGMTPTFTAPPEKGLTRVSEEEAEVEPEVDTEPAASSSADNRLRSSQLGAPLETLEGLQRSTSRSSSVYSVDSFRHGHSPGQSQTPSTASPASPATPRTPSPDHLTLPQNLLDDTEPQNKKGKGRAHRMPFRFLEGNHTFLRNST